MIVTILAGVLGYSFSGTTPTPKKVWFDSAGGDVIFDHSYHESLAECQACHHDYDEKDTSSETEMNCRACHYFGEERETRSEDDTHKRFIGASCTNCHKAKSMETACETCHIGPGLAFRESGRIMTPLPKTVKFETDGGLVKFNHKLHIGEDVDEPCSVCHHAFVETEGLEGLEREKRCRVCHYERADKIPEHDDENHNRYIGANCTECHDAEECEACHT